MRGDSTPEIEPHNSLSTGRCSELFALIRRCGASKSDAREIEITISHVGERN